MKFDQVIEEAEKDLKLQVFKKFAGLDPFSKAVFKIGNQYGIVKDSKAITWHSPNTLTIHDISGHIHNFIQDLREELKKEGDPAKFFYRTHIANSYGSRFDMEIVIGDDKTAEDVNTFPKYHYDAALYSLWYNAGLMDISTKDALALVKAKGSHDVSIKESKLNALKQFSYDNFKHQVEEIIHSIVDPAYIEWLNDNHVRIYEFVEERQRDAKTAIIEALEKLGLKVKAATIKHLSAIDPPTEEYSPNYTEWVADILFEKPLFTLKNS